MSKLFFTALIMGCSFSAMAQRNLKFDVTQGKRELVRVNDRLIAYRAYTKVVYVANPVDTTYQSMNIYIPEAYFNNQSINGYTAKTAPIFLPNQVGGYMPAEAGSIAGNTFFGAGARNLEHRKKDELLHTEKLSQLKRNVDSLENNTSTIAQALAQGYVVASPGARGRTTFDSIANVYTGKAPACIVDLKAAVRYLRYNDDRMPGSAERIISNGTSAGGALSALLGGSGNVAAYEPYLKAIGAAPARDNIFAVSAYCPITNLEHADMAYEWQLHKVLEYQKMDISMLDYKVERKLVKGMLTKEEQSVAEDLSQAFPLYINNLHLRNEKGQLLTLDAEGEGSFKEWVKSFVIASAQRALPTDSTVRTHDFLTIEGDTVKGLDWDAYMTYMGRQKLPPAFDALDLSSGENMLFGDKQTDKKHFTIYAATHNTAKEAQMAEADVVRLLNPLYYIGEEGTATAPHWRIRHGSYDKDTGLAIPTILATRLMNTKHDVDFALPWDKPHSGDYDLPELFDWINHLMR